MRLKLNSDVFFTVGTGFRPVDLVCKSTQTRIGLSEDEAAVAMLLMEGAPAGETLLRLIRKHGVCWELATLETYLERLKQSKLLYQGETPPAVAPSIPKTFGVKDTAVDEPSIDTIDEAPDTDVVEVGDFPKVVEEAQQPDPVLGRFRADLRQRQLADGSIEILVPSSGQRRRFTVDTVRLAQLFDGARTADEIVAAAQLEGMPASREIVARLAHKLTEHDMLVSRLVTGPIQKVDSWQDTISDSDRQTLPKVPSAAYAPTQLHRTSSPPVAQDPVDQDSIEETVPGRTGELERQQPIATGPAGVDRPAPRVPTRLGDAEFSAPSPTQQKQPQRAPALQQEPQPEGLGGSLATALILLRDRKYDEARQFVEQLLLRSPKNMQAETLLQLIAAEQSRSGKSKGRMRLLLVGVGGAVLLCCVGALFLPVTERIEIPCQAERIPRGTIKSTIKGKIERMAVKDGSLVHEGQLVAVIVNEGLELQQKLAEQKLADLADLLRLMRTGGTDEDEQKQNSGVKTLQRQLLKRCADDDRLCRLRMDAKREALRIAKLKLRHCEWEAYPEEIEKVEKKVNKTMVLRDKYQQAARQQLHSTQAGRVSELSTSGEIWPGDVVAKLYDARTFNVKFVHPALQPGHAVEIILGKFASFQTYLGKVVSRDSKAVLVDIAADVSKVNFASSCKAKLGERTILAKKMLRMVGGGSR